MRNSEPTPGAETRVPAGKATTTAVLAVQAQKSFYRRLRHWWLHSFLLCALLRALFWLLTLMPLGVARAFGRFAAWWVYLFDFSGQHTGIQNLARVFPELNRAQCVSLLRRNYRHLGICAVEFCRMYRISRTDLRALFVLEPGALETARAARDEGRGVIVAGSHIGAWELSCVAAPELGMELVAIAPPFPSPSIEQLSRGVRERFGTRMIQRRAALWALFRALRKGKTVAITSDFYGGRTGPRVPFFGHPAHTFDSAAWLHLKTGAPLLNVLMLRRPDGRYDCRIQRIEVPAPAGSDQEKVLAILTRINAEFEAVIREFPEQWLWRNKRWRSPRVMK